VECVISLPSNLFFGTSIATNILVLAKNKSENKTFFIDASEQYKKETNNNILEESNIKKIVEEFDSKKTTKYFSRLVDNEEIRENDYNLSVSTYIEPEDKTPKVNIDVLNKEIEETVTKIDKLRASIDEIIKDI